VDSRQPYLSGPHILRDALIEKVRSLPLGGEILVTPGQEVRPDTVVAHLNPGGYLHFVNVARELDIPFHLAAQCVVKDEGDTVRRGEILAARPAALGLLLAECRSPSDGIVEKIYPSGHVTVRSYPVPVLAFVSGRVVDLVPGTQVSILTSGTLVQGVFGLGGDRHGPLYVLGRKDRSLAGAPPGAVVVQPGPAGRDLIEACLTAGAVALVAASCHWADLKALESGGRPPALPGSSSVGAGEKVPLTLVLTEGFGETGATRGIFDTLARLDGREASVNGFTQLRAGVERPELIVPHGAVPDGRPGDGSVPVRVGRRTRIYVDRSYRLPRLEPGARVRLVRAPYAGLEGEVVDLPVEARRIATGAVMPVAVIRLRDGRRVAVLKCNLVTTDETVPGLPASAGSSGGGSR
jgi:hypothetical protein